MYVKPIIFIIKNLIQFFIFFLFIYLKIINLEFKLCMA